MKDWLVEKAKKIAETVVSGDFDRAKKEWSEATKDLMAFECVMLRDKIREIEGNLSKIRNEEEFNFCVTCEDSKLFAGIKLTPTHNGSKNCKNGSIASGGTKSHCSCGICF